MSHRLGLSRTLNTAAAAAARRLLHTGAQHEQYDVVILGTGIAGLSAALQASLSKPTLRILLLDRFAGGGAASISGGVVYAGGGTKQQIEAGHGDDTPENLYQYLKRECGGVVDDKTLRTFCEQSPGMIEWLEKEGNCKFGSNLCEYKTSYPKDEFTLYYSGNEKAYPYTLTSKPAPRGHRHSGSGMTGKHIISNLFRAVVQKPNVTFRPFSQVDALSLSSNQGARATIEYRHFPQSSRPTLHKIYENLIPKLYIGATGLAKSLGERSQKIFNGLAKAQSVTCSAVVLAMGGFIHNPSFQLDNSRPFGEAYWKAGMLPLGTLGDDGTGIRLGHSVGGKVDFLDRFTAWRFLTPPEAFLSSISIGKNGKRIGNEGLYGATWSERLIHDHGGEGWIIVDDAIWKEAWKQKGEQCSSLQRIQIELQLRRFHWKGSSLEQLGKKIGLVPDAVEEMKRTIHSYNDAVKEGGSGDPFHKQPSYCRPLVKPPFYAINVGLKGPGTSFSPAVGLTLGGLVVDGQTGSLIHAETGERIEGVFAAGRNAVGICSNSYVSGLSLADGVFSGRRAARSIVKLLDV